MTAKQLLLLSVLLVLLAGVVGWSHWSGPDQRGIAVSGSVTFEGERLGAGRIIFTPDPNTAAPAAAAAIANGQYALPTDAGLLPGTYLVRVLLPAPTKLNLMNHTKAGARLDPSTRADRRLPLNAGTGPLEWTMPQVIAPARQSVQLDFAFLQKHRAPTAKKNR